MRKGYGVGMKLSLERRGAMTRDRHLCALLDGDELIGELYLDAEQAKGLERMIGMWNAHTDERATSEARRSNMATERAPAADDVCGFAWRRNDGRLFACGLRPGHKGRCGHHP